MASPNPDDDDALLQQLTPDPPRNTTQPVPTPDPRDPRFTSANAPRVIQNAQGGWDLTEHGNTRNLQADEVDKAKGYADQFWKDNPTGWQAGNQSSIGDAYRQVLGRDPDAEGLAAHQKNPGGFGGVINTIVNSDEAGKRLAAPPITSIMAGGAATSPAARRGWNNLNLTAPQQRGLNQFEGFNADRALAGSDDDSVKDAFQRWAGGLDFDLRGKTKQQIKDYYRSQLQSAKDYGLDIQDIKGEKILINTKERGPEWIDSVIRAGGENPAFGWQAEYDNIGNAALGGARTTPVGTSVAPAPVTTPAATTPTTPSTASADLQAQIDALIAGKDPMEEEALLASLRP